MKKNLSFALSLFVLTVTSAVAAPPAAPTETEMNRAAHAEIIDTLLAKLNSNYVFPEKAKEVEVVLRQRQRDGKYDAITDGKQFAIQLSDDIEAVIHDKHLSVRFSSREVPPDNVGPKPKTRAEWEKVVPPAVLQMARTSKLGVEKVDHLGPKIGYLQISEFPPAFLVGEKYAVAMNELSDTDGLIIDLRDNRGGGPECVALLVSYFVDERTRLNDLWERSTDQTTQHWTQDTLEGKRYGGKKPVIIMAGPQTKSAGEDFVYTMQALKRATVIGAPTWGGAHPARPYRLNDHFSVSIPGLRSISPITHTNWEGVGVIPDIAAETDNALTVARDLMQKRLASTEAPVAAYHTN
ncbi:MAG: S41 family peptidase [Pseudomonadota bacterium]